MTLDQTSAIVADDHELFGAALQGLLEKHLKFRRCHVGLEFDRVWEILQADPSVGLLTLDIAMPGMAGGESVRRLRAQFPKLRIMIVSAITSRDVILQYLGWGVHGFVPKTYSIMEILRAIKSVHSGQIFVPAMVSEFIPDEEPLRNRSVVQAPPTVNLLARLSERQRSVLELIANGYSNKQIARALGLAEGTVKVHVHGLFTALNINSRVAAVTALASSEAAGHGLLVARVAPAARPVPTMA